MNTSTCLPGSQEDAPAEVLHFENEHIRLKVEKKGDCQVVFHITTLANATQAAWHAACKRVAKEVTVAGFRKGKAPENVVKEKHPKWIEQEFKDILSRNAFHEACALSQTFLYSKEAPVTLKKFEKHQENSYFVEVHFDRFPTVPSVLPESLTIQKIEPEPVQEKDVGAKMENLRLYHATWTQIKDRPAQLEDFVIIDVQEKEDGHLWHENSRFQLKEGKMPTWALESVVGMQTGKTKEVIVPANVEENGDDKERICLITLHEIQTAALPEINEELAKKAGADTVDELYAGLRQNLAKMRSDEAKHKMRLTMRDLLLSTYPFDLPSHRLHELHQECHRIAEQSDCESEAASHKLAHQLFDDAEDTLSLAYLIPKMVHDFKIPLPDAQEVHQRLMEYVLSRYMAGEKGDMKEAMQQHKRTVENDIIVERVLDYLIEHAKKT